MSKYVAYFLLIIVTCFSSCREDDVEPEQKKCAKIIENLPHYKQKVIDFSNRVAFAGVVTGYFDGKDLKLATATNSTQRGYRKDGYFFHNDHLIAVQQDVYSYNEPKYLTKEVAATTGDSAWYDETKTTKKTSWCYFYSGHMVKWINETGKIIPDADPRFDEMNDKLLQDAEKLKQMLQN